MNETETKELLMKNVFPKWLYQAGVAALCAGLFSLAGCTTMSDVISDKDNGTSRVYNITKDQAWDIATHVFRWNGADAIEAHADEHYMLTSASRRPFSGASFMGAGSNRKGITKLRSPWLPSAKSQRRLRPR